MWRTLVYGCALAETGEGPLSALRGSSDAEEHFCFVLFWEWYVLSPLSSGHFPVVDLSLADHSESLPLSFQYSRHLVKWGYKLSCCNKEPPSITHVFLSHISVQRWAGWWSGLAGSSALEGHPGNQIPSTWNMVFYNPLGYKVLEHS